MAEWLGKALQKLLQRFESARDLSLGRSNCPAFFILIMQNRLWHITGITAALLLILSCFLPWAHYASINETFTGFHVKRFPGGPYYGRAGLIITILTSIILLGMFSRTMWMKKVNLFLAAMQVAYAVRTYILFTSSIFPGEVEKKIGIILLIPLSVLLLISAVFPKGGSNV